MSRDGTAEQCFAQAGSMRYWAPILAVCLAIAVTTWLRSQRGASWDDFVPNLGFQGLKTGFLWPEYYENVQ